VYGSGIPETLTDGFWNNIGQCCGSAGVAEFAIAMHETIEAATGAPEQLSDQQVLPERHLEFARGVADDLLSRGTVEGNALMWVQAEHRTQPEFLVAQTGYMQGAAGIGMMLLHLDAAINGTPSPHIVFPDSPF
jgi:hypothetical protein